MGYRLIAKIGEGGMGEVWRAADTTLGREVAVKILPAAFASDPERLARFEREAKLLASLNHPNIATVHGFHEEDGKRFLAMELVPGEDLAERLKQGPLPLSEALDVARQTAEALEAAHEHGIVHRDLKPANVKLTPEGRVKVLDFGLAKGDVASATTSRDSALSPTITSLGTVAGVILGTAAYMSPEQARGKPVDKRADVWAFGCLLFEMLSRKRPFDGETVSDTLAAVLAKEPDWSVLPSATPPRIRDLIARCLEKDPRRRLRDVGEARIEIENVLANRSASGPVAAVPVAGVPRRSPAAPIAIAVAILATAVAGWSFLRPAPAASPAKMMRLRVERPPGAAITGPGYFAISPDGTAIVFTFEDASGAARLWLRELSEPSGHELPGTDGNRALFPFWSSDSRTIAFFADAKLKKIPRAGGAVQTICDAPNGRGGTWSPAGVIVFAPTPFSPLMKISPDGGILEPVTTFDKSRKQSSHRFPTFLPDGRHFLYAVQPALKPTLLQIEVGSLDDPVGHPLLMSRNAPRYAAPGYLLFARDQALVAQKIDLASFKMSGDIIPLADHADVVDAIVGAPSISTASDGTVVYDERDARPTDGVWYSRDGRPMETAFRHKGRVYLTQMSHRGDRVALLSLMDTGAVGSVVSFADKTETRVVRENLLPRFVAWTPDDDRLVFDVYSLGQPALVSMTVDGGDVRKIFDMENVWLAIDCIAPDGSILLDDPFRGQFTDIVVLPKDGGTKTTPYLATASNEQAAVVSRDGRFVVYASDASGRAELYVDSFPKAGAPKRVSLDGATPPGAWRRDGRELYFLSPDGRTMMACGVATSPTLTIGKPHALFTLPPDVFANAPSPDGDRFLLSIPVGEPRMSLTLVQNWSAQLK